MDIIGHSDIPLRDYDSNPGQIKISHGGVGRNIAENCCKLNEKVSFATVFGNDDFAQLLKAGCMQYQMDLSLSKDSQIHSTSIYLAILDQNQDMKVAISDMNLLQEVDELMIQKVLNSLKKEDILVMDTNLEQSVIEKVAEQCPCPIVMDPISCAKAVKIKNCLSKIHTLKPNRYEAEVLCGFALDSEEKMVEAVRYFLKQGVKEIFISMSEKGTIAATQDEIILVKPKPISIVNATGGGDSFLAALIAYRELDLMERCRYATCAAISTISVPETVCKELSKAYLEKKMKEIEMEGSKLCISA